MRSEAEIRQEASTTNLFDEAKTANSLSRIRNYTIKSSRTTIDHRSLGCPELGDRLPGANQRYGTGS